ncbi:hypothetical protein HTZ97_16310 [Desulfuromonas acetoxidans]|uniref:Uncharacterized protein n=1 Tax=Desulfuromonas acetoxidans (strain DSM 684 / 11070) TaxID=281689 RepID=Q1K066_DESA6|nr:hypothetical protein [Desulfuromonas acetoxidans]EAT16075.1 hypothetical protein Dace_2376 [Desulfuromonas acetoxidans DSM 684]MBF0646891.1 hypothetical protein [Desulfuromonas acetoxidans]NVD26168.1 hypothetical protein [Desulfuromonas acetoxidans]NVE18020.1 hypothetical protein [Desulfuromonas acetoxidans]
MAERGDKTKLYPVAMRMYGDGKSLTEIEDVLGVSRQTLSVWKRDTLTPGEELDEWDKAREKRLSYVQRMENLLDRELEHAENSQAGQGLGATYDSISKLGALVQRFKQAEQEAQMKSAAQRQALFLDFVRDLIDYGSRNDDELVSVLERNFDDLVQWGREKYEAR